MIRDTEAYAQALAEIRALRITVPPYPGRFCCAGDYDGFVWHWRSGTTPCVASRASHAAYGRKPHGPKPLIVKRRPRPRTGRSTS